MRDLKLLFELLHDVLPFDWDVVLLNTHFCRILMYQHSEELSVVIVDEFKANHDVRQRETEEVGFKLLEVPVHVHVDFTLKGQTAVVDVKETKAVCAFASIYAESHDSTKVHVFENIQPRQLWVF